MLDFWRAMASCLPSAHLTSVQQSWLALASASTMLGAVCRGQQREVVGIGLVGHHVYVRDRAIRHKMVEEGWRDDRPLWDPDPARSPHWLAGRRVVLLVDERHLPAAEVHHEPSNQVMAESGEMDHLNEEAVRDCVEWLRDIHRYGYGSARWLTLVKARDHPSRDRE